MFIAAKRNLILPSKNGSNTYEVARGFVGNIPDWAADTPYFEALVKDGKISVPKSHKDKDLAAAEETPVKRRKPKEE